MASTFDIFKQAERIEIVAASIYGVLAKRFRDDEAHALFVRLEGEELQHASRVRLLASAYRSDPKLLGRVNGADGLEACLAEAEKALDEVKGGGWGPGLDEVTRRVAALEDRLARAHANLLALNGNGALREFFEQLARMDDAHVRLLVER